MTTGTGHRTIVTFFEEYGAGATTIAPRVAERLGVPYLHQALSSVQIEEAHEEEADQSLLSRLLRRFTILPEPDVDIAWAVDARSDNEIVTDNTSLVLDSTAEGGVVLGRNATVIHADTPGALHVRIMGPVQQRVARAAEEARISPAQAELRQQREDRMRAEIARKLYQWDPHDDIHYDLILNTGRISLDQAVDMIVAAYRARFAAR